MLNLKILRTARKLTQKDLAQALETTQQTIGRWESGKAQPSISDLGKIAALFKCSVDDILGVQAPPPRRRDVVLCKISPFWGNLGIKLNPTSPIKWYPISNEERMRLHEELPALQDGGFIGVTTNNNRELLIRPSAVNQILMVDDNCDAYHDWAVVRDDYQGLPIEMYQGLEALLAAEYDEGEWDALPHAKQIELLALARDFDFFDESNATPKDTKGADGHDLRCLNFDELSSFLTELRIHFVDGVMESYQPDSKDLDTLYYNGNNPNCLAGVISMSSRHGDFDSYISTSRVALFDAPFLRVNEAMGEHSEMEGIGEPDVY